MTVRFVEMDRLLTTSKRVTKTENKKREERRRGGESRGGGREGRERGGRTREDTSRRYPRVGSCLSHITKDYIS